MADNPFSALLDPEKQGTISGFIGGIMGKPTAGQAAGEATGEALKQLSALREQGLPPQQALLKFFQTPEGQDYFANAGKDGLKTLTDSLTATTPPIPAMHNVAPGGQLMQQDPNSGAISTVMSNPTTEQQNFKAFTTIAALPQSKIRELAVMQVDKTKDPSEAATAIADLVQNHGMDPAVGKGILAGSIKVLPVKDQYGNDTGNVSVVDLGTGTNTLIKPGEKMTKPSGAPVADPNAPPPVANPGATPETGSGTGVIPPVNGTSTIDPAANKKYFGSKADMVLGGGLMPNLASGASKIGEQIDSKLVIPEGARAQDRENLLKIARNAILGMADLGGGIGSNKAVVQSFADLVPSGAINESPHSNVQKFIRLHQNIDQQIAAEEKASVDPSLPQSERVASAKRSQAWKKVLLTIPTMDELHNINEAILAGTSDALNVQSGVKSIIEGGKKALKSATSQASGVKKDAGLDSSEDFSASSVQDLTAVDPRKLSPAGLINFRNRLQSLKAGAKKGAK